MDRGRETVGCIPWVVTFFVCGLSNVRTSEYLVTVYRNDNPAGLVSFSPAPPRDLLPDCPPTEDIVAYAQQVLPQKFDVSAQEIAEGRAVWLTDMAVSPGTDIELALVAALRCLFLEKIFVSHAWCLSPQV